MNTKGNLSDHVSFLKVSNVNYLHINLDCCWPPCEMKSIQM